MSIRKSESIKQIVTVTLIDGIIRKRQINNYCSLNYSQNLLSDYKMALTRIKRETWEEDTKEDILIMTNCTRILLMFAVLYTDTLRSQC